MSLRYLERKIRLTLKMTTVGLKLLALGDRVGRPYKAVGLLSQSGKSFPLQL